MTNSKLRRFTDRLESDFWGDIPAYWFSIAAMLEAGEDITGFDHEAQEGAKLLLQYWNEEVI